MIGDHTVYPMFTARFGSPSFVIGVVMVVFSCNRVTEVMVKTGSSIVPRYFHRTRNRGFTGPKFRIETSRDTEVRLVKLRGKEVDDRTLFR